MDQAGGEGDFVDRCEAAAEEVGVAFVGPAMAKDILAGDMTSFTALVNEQRKTLDQ